ncbi:MAG TPA: hypothetical protein VM345_11365 [Acidimicrobiales bacterium]|jgi:hypothetical protein|nr:hypothetical protein [Acidimicrobiales bacterium]
MNDLEDLASLSHALERSALALADAKVGVRLIIHELEVLAAGQREALAIALSYLLRHRSLGTHPDADALADAIDAVVATLRRTN